MIRSVYLIILSVFLLIQCESVPTDPISQGDESYLLPLAGSQYSVDSIVIQPQVGGPEQLSSQSIWTLAPFQSEADETTSFLVREEGDSTNRQFFWDWTVEEGKVINTLSGLSYLSLVTPFIVNTQWDPLLFTSGDIEVTIAGQPIQLHKGWSAKIDSIGSYLLPNGNTTNAVWVSLSSSENLLELREVKEVYGQGVGLLERHMRIFDTQNTDANIPWLDRAERGFQLDLLKVN